MFALISAQSGAAALTDEEVKVLVRSKDIPAYKLETILADHTRGVAIRYSSLYNRGGYQVQLSVPWGWLSGTVVY